jgi:Fe-S-cluster containining protein
MVHKNKTITDSIFLTKKTPLSYVEKLLDDCNKCGHCCSYSSGFFLDEDIKKISNKIGMKKNDFIEKFLEEKEIFNTKVHQSKIIKENEKSKKNTKHYGKCIFLDEHKECSIHDVKPLHCRIATGCKTIGEQIHVWFLLNYLVNSNNPESIRQWAKYLEVNKTIPGGKLIELVEDKEKLSKMLNYELLK